MKRALCKTGLGPCSPDGGLINLEVAASEPFFSSFSFIGCWGIVKHRPLLIKTKARSQRGFTFAGMPKFAT